MIDEILDYFDQRADADQPSGQETPTPNEEMRLLMATKEIERNIKLAIEILDPHGDQANMRWARVLLGRCLHD